jgi:hypothetical protein
MYSLVIFKVLNPLLEEKFEDTKDVIRSRKSKDRQQKGRKDKQRSTKYYTEK